MWFYFDSASSASAPATIRFAISSPQQCGARVRAQFPLRIPSSPPLSPLLLPTRTPPAQRGVATRSSSQHPQALMRGPAATTPARTHRRTHPNFLRAPILNSRDPPPSPRAPRLARLEGSAAPSPSLRLPPTASCAAGKRRQVLPRPEGSRRTSAPAGSLAPPTAAAARAPSRTLTGPSRSGHLSARPRDTHSHTTPRFGSGGGPVGRLRQR